MRHFKTMEHFKAKAKRMAELAKPQFFRPTTKWEDWYPSFLPNLLKHQPGRDGVPLAYVVHDKDDPDLTSHETYLDDLIAAASHSGESFREDADTVHTLITKHIAGNTEAKAKIQRHEQVWNGRLDIRALRAHYEGVGANSLDIRKADKILQELHYTGEKKPHMWWAEFEKQLTSAFHYYQKHEGRKVYSNAMKIQILLRKVNADFLMAHKAVIERETGEVNHAVTYESVLTTFRNAVNAKFPPQLTPQRARRMQETSRGRTGGRGRGRSQGGQGYGNGKGRGGRGWNNRHVTPNMKRQRDNSVYERLSDGSFLELHPSFAYPDPVWRMIPLPARKRLQEERAVYRAATAQRAVQQLGTANARQGMEEMSQLTHHQGDETSHTPMTMVRIQQTDQASAAGTQMSQHTIMGGRKEQEARRKMGAVRSSRKISQTASSGSIGQEPTPGITANNETDTNADTCCLGINFRILHHTGRVADVLPYDVSYPAIEGVPIVTGATAWDDPLTGDIFLIIVNEGLYYGAHLDHSLINPNQVRKHGNLYQDNPFDDTNALTITTEMATIPLQVIGTKIQWQSRSPTDFEIQTCPRIILTSDTPWDPELVTLAQVSRSSIEEVPYAHDRSGIEEVPYAHDVLAETNFRRLSESTSLQDDIPTRRTFISSKRHPKITAEDLSERWMIGLNQVRATILATTQRGIRSAILPLSRRYRADRILNLRRLEDHFATDTFFADTLSKTQSKCAQVFSTKAGFTAVYPMRNASGAAIAQALSDFIHAYGIPARLTFDGASAQVGPNTPFMKLIRKHGINYHVSEPRRPNQNPAESAIRELKRKWYRLMARRKVHPRLWDHAVQWLSEIGNVTVSTSRYANGRTSLEMITGETPDAYYGASGFQFL